MFTIIHKIMFKGNLKSLLTLYLYQPWSTTAFGGMGIFIRDHYLLCYVLYTGTNPSLYNLIFIK
jgi:hypothetical protein